MSDRDRELPSRREVDQAIDALSKRLNAMEQVMQRQQGRQGVLVGAMVGLVAFLTIVVIISNAVFGS